MKMFLVFSIVFFLLIGTAKECCSEINKQNTKKESTLLSKLSIRSTTSSKDKRDASKSEKEAIILSVESVNENELTDNEKLEYLDIEYIIYNSNKQTNQSLLFNFKRIIDYDVNKLNHSVDTESDAENNSTNFYLEIRENQTSVANQFKQPSFLNYSILIWILVNVLT